MLVRFSQPCLPWTPQAPSSCLMKSRLRLETSTGARATPRMTSTTPLRQDSTQSGSCQCRCVKLVKYDNLGGHENIRGASPYMQEWVVTHC
jgi:hypothetical protein